MRVFSQVVFDAWVDGTAYTPPELDQLLSQADKLAIHAVADRVGGAGVTLLVAVEHSGDGRNFVQKYGTAEIDRLAINPDQTNSLVGIDDGSRPSLEFARLAIQVSGGGGAHVRVMVTGKTDGWPSAMPVGMREAGAKTPCCEGCAKGSGCEGGRKTAGEPVAPVSDAIAVPQQQAAQPSLAAAPGPPAPDPPPFPPPAGLLGTGTCLGCWANILAELNKNIVECASLFDATPQGWIKNADCVVKKFLTFDAEWHWLCKPLCGGTPPGTWTRDGRTIKCQQCRKWAWKLLSLMGPGIAKDMMTVHTGSICAQVCGESDVKCTVMYENCIQKNTGGCAYKVDPYGNTYCSACLSQCNNDSYTGNPDCYKCGFY